MIFRSSALKFALRATLIAFFCSLLTFLTACGGAPEYLNLSLEAEHDANNNAPVGVAVLVVYNEDVFKELRKMSAGEWFEQSDQRKRDNPDRIDFELYEWELMPGQKVPERRMHLQGRKARGLVFADYFAGTTDHRELFQIDKRVLIRLGKEDVSVKKLD